MGEAYVEKIKKMEEDARFAKGIGKDEVLPPTNVKNLFAEYENEDPE